MRYHNFEKNTRLNYSRLSFLTYSFVPQLTSRSLDDVIKICSHIKLRQASPSTQLPDPHHPKIKILVRILDWTYLSIIRWPFPGANRIFNFQNYFFVQICFEKIENGFLVAEVTFYYFLDKFWTTKKNLFFIKFHSVDNKRFVVTYFYANFKFFSNGNPYLNFFQKDFKGFEKKSLFLWIRKNLVILKILITILVFFKYLFFFMTEDLRSILWSFVQFRTTANSFTHLPKMIISCLFFLQF